MSTEERNRWGRTWVALAVPLAAAGVQWLLWDQIRPYIWFLFYPAVFLSSWIGGWRGGLPATLLSAALAIFVFEPPMLGWSVANSRAWISVAGFIGMGALFCHFHERLRQASRQAATALDETQRAKELLEERVRERTAAVERTGATLRASEEKFAKVFRDAPVITAITDLETGVYLDFNEELVLRSGFKREELLGHTAVGLGWLEAEGHQRLLEALQADGRVTGLDLRLHAKDGRVLDVLVNGEPLVIGGRTCLLTVTFDITDRRRAEAALRANEELLAGVFDSVVSHIAVLDADGKILAVNEAWRRFAAENRTAAGIPPGDWDVGANYLAVCRRSMAAGADGAQAAHDGIVAVLAGRVPRFTLEYPCHGPRESRWFTLVVTPLGTGGRAVVNHLNITERKRAETILQQRLDLQDQLAKIAETVPGMVFAFRLRPDGTACIPYCTPVIDDLWGFRPEEVQRDFGPALARVHPEDLARVQTSIAESARLLTTWREAFRILHPRKGERWLEGHSKPQRERDGGTLWHGFVQDVTERMRAEVALRESEERFAGIFNASPTAIGISRLRDGCLLDVNEAFVRLYGYTREELVGHTASDLQLWAAPERETPMAELRERRRLLNASLTIRRKGGELRGVLASLELTDFAGEPCIVGGLTDVTELRRAEALLRESEERFRQIAENSNEVFWITDPGKQTMLYVSPAYETVWGRSCDSLYRSPREWFVAIHEEDRAHVMAAAFTKQERGTYNETFRVLRPDGEVRWVHDRAFPLRDEAGRVYRLLGTAADVTETRKLEAQYRQAQKMEAIGTLAGGIAHDFNNILGAILGFGELIKLRGKADPETLAHVDDILRAGRRAVALVRQILTFSRQERQERRPIELGPVVREALALLRASIPTTIEFRIELAPNTATVLAEPSQIHQAVMNLGTNAWHAMKGRSGRLSVRLANFAVDESLAAMVPQLRPGSYVRLTMGDNGEGMDRATVDRVFEPFFTTKAPGEGTGLGLSVIHGIMHGHDGAITVYSQLGEGTLVHLYFPALPDAASEATEAAAAVPAGRGERILVVDDEEPMARLATVLLCRLGYEASPFTSVETALAAVQADPAAFDLVFTDQNMPGMTGIELAGRLKELRPDLPIILATGFSADLTPDKARTFGIAEVLQKPVTLPILGAAVRQVLDHRQTTIS